MNQKLDEIIGVASIVFAAYRVVDPDIYIEGFLAGISLAQRIETLRREGNSEDQIIGWLLKMLQNVEDGNGPNFPTLKEKRTKRAETN